MNNTARTAGRLFGTAYAHTRRTVELIDWQEVAQIVWHGLVTLAILTFLAGEFTGRTLHRLNDALSRVWVGLLVTEPEPAAEPAQPAPAPPATHPLALLAVELEQHTRRELTAITGIRRKVAKAQLVAAYLAV